MKLCIPTLCNYDGVDRLLRSALAGSLEPTGYVVLDNGSGYSLERLRATLGKRAELGELITPGTNLGVAASWNLFLERYGKPAPVVISNDDIVLGETAFSVLADQVAQHPIAGAGFALFVQTPECTRSVGYYDENFWPAYHEDIDYRLRLERAGLAFKEISGLDIQHLGWETTTQLGNPAWLTDARARNYSYLVAKWGANAGGDTYREPFNGHVPPGWALRTRLLPPLPLREEFVRELSELIGGRCLVFGREPAHPDERFDVILLSGHEHASITADVERARALLTADGVLVIINASPHSEEMQLVPHNGCYAWTGDVWRSIVRLRQERELAVRVVDSDYGLALVVPGAADADIDPSPTARPVAELSYSDLVADRARLLGLLSGWEWREWLEKVQPRPATILAPPSAEPLPAAPVRINLGCSDAHLSGYLNVDRVPPADCIADLTKPWPWETSSVDELRAVDLVEHLPDKAHTMNEAFRVLKPGGLFHVVVPTTDGRGAWQDPTHVSYWNRNSFWYYESGNAHRERFGQAYGISARFHVESENEIHDAFGQIYHLDIRLRADKPTPQTRPAPDTLVIIFDQLLRSDTTGTHLLNAFRRLGVPVLHYEPCLLSRGGQPVSRGYAELDLSQARAILCIDDDIGWELPKTDVPMYYWCIDSYRMDDPLYIVGSRRERVRHFTQTFYVQRREALGANAPWLPLAVDPELCTYSPRPKIYDWCFIGHLGHEREAFLQKLASALPNCFHGTAFGKQADEIYNQSTLALNLSRGPDINMRMFEGQATSALLISNRVNNGEDELFHHLPLFISTEDCIAQMRMWLMQPELTSELARAQADEMAAHTYEVRARTLLRAMGWSGF